MAIPLHTVLYQIPYYDTSKENEQHLQNYEMTFLEDQV